MTSPLYSPRDTALLLVDFLNDFLADDGKLAPEIGPMLAQLNLRAGYARLIEGARRAGLKLFYVPHGVDEHSFDDVPYIHPRIQHGIDRRITWKGGYGDDFYAPLQPQPHDTIIAHHRQYDGFFGTDLERQLHAQGIEKVVLAGHTTHTCVEGTGRHALEAGFHVTFLKDAVAEFSEPPHRFALDYSYGTFGHAALTIDEFLAAVAPPPRILP
jgi:nicotinamidase-related amidase